jgi:hypothetical protein
MVEVTTMTYQQAAQTAIDVQDAVNLSGVVHSFAEAMSAISEYAWQNGKGTEWKNSHPVVTLFLDKLVDLNGRQLFESASLTFVTTEEWIAKVDEVKQIAQG